MATKSFLEANDLELAPSLLLAPALPPDGNEALEGEFVSFEFSQWLGERLLKRLSQHPDWAASDPIALGSWARGELSPKSDIDLLFGGDESAVGRLVSDFSKQGLKLRYRMPENIEDWTVGVLPFDVLALFSAVPFTSDARAKWQRQISLLKKRGGEFRRSLLKAMWTERRVRAERYDSISNFLEPNLKFGPGGLRDLEQALVAFELFQPKFLALDPGKIAHTDEVLKYYKKFFLLVRQKLHLADGGGDVLAAPEQRPIAEWLGFADGKSFMREIQKGLSRVSFYADWMIEVAIRSARIIQQVEAVRLAKPADLFSALENDASILMQSRVRLKSDRLFAAAAKTPQFSKALGKKLNSFLMPDVAEAQLVALFRSRLIDHVVPEIRKVVGHVQHDQYHRFSVDAHILQALRELKRLRKNPKLAGRLKPYVTSLTEREWLMLSYACLYHDIAKGREGHHAIEGKVIAEFDLKRFGKDASFVREVTWIVEEHLGLSSAAFRENSRAPETWRKLNERGVTGRRLPLLLVFTVVDIRATNPEAWTPWKERLMHELVTQIEKPEVSSLLALGQMMRQSKLTGVRELAATWPESLDPFLIQAVPPRLLIEDLRALTEIDHANSLTPKIIRLRGGQTWVRLHSAEDRSGLFLKFVTALGGVGLSVRHASVLTHKTHGVYDWFEVKTTKTAPAIEKLLARALASEALLATDSKHANLKSRAPVRFDAVECVGQDAVEWVISFRGKDQTGALIEAARVLAASNLEIRWAKVHTWGRQIDDVFGVNARAGVKPVDAVREIRTKLKF